MPQIAGRSEILNQYKSSLASYLGTLHLMESIALTIEDTFELSPLDNTITKVFIDTANKVLGAIGGHFSNIQEAITFLRNKKADIITALGSPMRLADETNHASLVTQPEQVIRLFTSQIRQYSKARLGLLLDQYEMIPMECQPIFNPLLKRENAILFFTIVACRPFSFNPSLLTGSLQPGEDFSPVMTEYLPDDRDSYEKLLANVWERINPDGLPIEQILEGGIGNFAELSSRSIRLFLELCRSAGAFDIQGPKSVNDINQSRAAKEISGLVRDGLKVTSGVPFESIWRLILGICRKITLISDSTQRKLPYTVNVKSTDLFGLEYLSQESVLLLRKAFEEGAIQFLSREQAYPLSIPDKFCLAPILGPALNARVDRNVSVIVDSSEIEEIAKEHQWIKRGTVIPLKEITAVFLSISFEDLPETSGDASFVWADLRRIRNQICGRQGARARYGHPVM